MEGGIEEIRCLLASSLDAWRTNEGSSGVPRSLHPLPITTYPATLPIYFPLIWAIELNTPTPATLIPCYCVPFTTNFTQD